MTTCPQEAPAPLRCPTFEESLQATAALAPRGRAWPVNDGGGTVSRFLAWLTGLHGAVPAAGAWPAGYVQAGWFSALAAVRNYLETRLCALRLEFWCATHIETDDQWMLEYGLPDACEPFPILCVKVAAIGGTRCEYYAAIAAQAGWSIACLERDGQCGSAPGFAKAGRAQPGVKLGNAVIQISVFLNESPAYAGGVRIPPLAGKMKAGRPLSCGPDVSALVCLLSRIVHAEIQLVLSLRGSALSFDSSRVPFDANTVTWDKH